MISPTNFLAIADNIAKTLLDLESAYITNPTVNAPTVSTITIGQTGVSGSLESRIANLGSIQQEADLASPTFQVANNILAYMAITPQQFYALYTLLVIALDHHTAGVNAFLASNAISVHPEFANAFNYIAANAALLGVVTTAITLIASSNIFVPVTQTLGSITVTGTVGGNFTPGTPIDTGKYAAGQFYLINNGTGSSAGTATSFVVTYVNASGITTTSTLTLSGALGAGVSLIITGAIGVSVTGISIASGGASGDQFAVTVPPVRLVTY